MLRPETIHGDSELSLKKPRALCCSSEMKVQRLCLEGACSYPCLETLTWSGQGPSTVAVANCCDCHPQLMGVCTKQMLIVRRSHSL